MMGPKCSEGCGRDVWEWEMACGPCMGKLVEKMAEGWEDDP